MMTRWRALAAGLAVCIGVAAPALAQTEAAIPPCNAPGMTPVKPANSHVAEPGDYPILSTVLKEQGTTVLDIVIEEDGAVGNPRVFGSSGSMRLDEAAMDMVVQRWRYTPATQNGKPVACRWKVAVKWVVQDVVPELSANAGLVIQMGPEDYPAGASGQGEEGAVVLLVGIEDNGNVTLVTLLGSSGHADLDAASIALVGSKIKAINLQTSGKTLLVVIMVWSLKAK